MSAYLKPILYALVGALTATLLTTTSALAGSGVGGIFNLGQTNTVNAQTILSGNPGANPLLRVTGSGTAATLRADAGSGIAINGISTSGTGQSGQSTTGHGLSGFHVGATGSTSGVYGQTASTDPGSAGVTGRNLAGGPGLQAIVSGSNTVPPLKVNSSARIPSLNADLLDGINSTGFWQLGGNAGTTPGTNFLGTSDHTALEIKVNTQRALRIEPIVPTPNLIGGFSGNSVDAGHLGSVIAGGGTNGTGNANHVESDYDFVGAGIANRAGAIAGGDNAAVVAGSNNIASGGQAFVGAGSINTASGNYSSVIGGLNNQASAIHSTIVGGLSNVANGDHAAVVGGFSNTAGGNSAILGGSNNTALGPQSFAAGTHAKATLNGAFVWGDNTTTDLTSPAVNSFTVRASGGIWLGTTSNPSIPAGRFINTSTGAYLTSAGVWTNNSDRAKKHDLRPLSTRGVLDKVARMPITSWSYKAEQPRIRHIGPMAQDFYGAFGLGLDDKHITTIDEGGVALAAIQGLYRQNQALQRENLSLNARLAKLERAFSKLSR